MTLRSLAFSFFESLRQIYLFPDLTRLNYMMNTMVAEVQSNNLKEFKHYIENGGSDIKDYASAIEYTYDIPVNIYKSDTSDKVTQLNLVIAFRPVSGKYSILRLKYLFIIK